jgi:hypothetical protein
MTVRWRAPKTAAFLAAVWILGATVISVVVGGEVAGTRAAPYVWSAWGLLCLAVTYFVACLALNRTTVCVEAGKLIVRSGPLPDWGNSATDVREIEDVVASAVTTPGAKGPGGVAYVVGARTKAGKTIPIFAATAILDRERAEDLARRVEAMIWRAGA